jgi:hypothetical protein
LATRSFVARPDGTGYGGIYIHWAGNPSHQLPLLLTAYRHRFDGDLDTMTEHLIDRVSGWSRLGSDLLYGAPEDLLTALDYGDRPSTELAALAPDPQDRRRARFWITDQRTRGTDWGYVLHPNGIEVIPVRDARRGRIVPWATDPRVRISDSPLLWRPDRPLPVRRPSQVRNPIPAPGPPRPRR